MRTYLPYFAYAVLAAIVVYLAAVFAPRTYDVSRPASREGTSYWQLTTGSRIAYWKLETQAVQKQRPIIYLHGGPGGFITKLNLQTLAPLADDGHDVYLYDQIGSGQSDRLPDIHDYSAERHIRDLAEIITTIGAGKVILVGQSWGAILAALYAADHPDHVDRIVFTGPGPLPPIRAELQEVKAPDSLTFRRPPYSNRQANHHCANMRSRAMAWFARSLGIRIASDREADAFQTYLNGQLNKAVVCDTSNAPEAEAGGGFYAQVMTVQSLAHHPDPRGKLKDSKIPVMVIRGQCDSQPWGFAGEYLELFPDHQLAFIPNAGHAAYVEQPDRYLGAMREFLAGDTSARESIPGMLR